MPALSVRPSQFASAVLSLKGKPLKFDGYKPFETIYDVMPSLLVLKAGRQVGKSVSLAGAMTTESVLRKYFNTLYIAPISTQASRFSSLYLDPYLSGNLIKKHFVDATSKKNVFEKSFSNGSHIFLSYADTEQAADRIRGVNADMNLIDEAQDVAYEALPIIFETMSSSPFAFKRITGTAKNLNNTLQLYFDKTNGLEWCTKCPHCGKWTVPNDFDVCMKIIDNPEGPACPHCGKVVDMPNLGSWVATRPCDTDALGFHLPQFIFGSRTAPKKWAEIRDKAFSSTAYSPDKLANEVFGLASGVGGRILSFKEAFACCDSTRKAFDKAWTPDSRGINQCVLGVDWSVTGGSKSYTVITVLGSDYQGNLYLMHSERLNGIDILEQVKRVGQVFTQFNCQLIASDRGVGVLQVQLLQDMFGKERVFPVNYVASTVPLRWDSKGQFFAADRTMALDAMMLKMKIGKSRFNTPSWEVTASYWEDALSMYEEESQSGRKLYRKDDDKPDDWMHSVTFASLGLMILRGEYRTVDEVPTQC